MGGKGDRLRNGVQVTATDKNNNKKGEKAISQPGVTRWGYYFAGRRKQRLFFVK